MPQELRWGENITGPIIPEVRKMLTVYGHINSPSVVHRNLQLAAIQVFWPEMDILDGELFFLGLRHMDEIKGVFKPQKDLPN